MGYHLSSACTLDSRVLYTLGGNVHLHVNSHPYLSLTFFTVQIQSLNMVVSVQARLYICV